MGKEYPYPELFSHTIPSGETLYGMIFKPKNLDHREKYPVVLNVYGGPEVQLVSNTFKVRSSEAKLCLAYSQVRKHFFYFQGYRQGRNHLLASQGFCVVCIDSRGSLNRGSAFEAHLRLRMGQVEMQDQVDVLQGLADKKPYLDMSRVAVHGWSYGGYLSLMALAKFPHIFKVSDPW